MKTPARTCALMSMLLLGAAFSQAGAAQGLSPFDRLRTAAAETSLVAPDVRPWHIRLDVTIAPGNPGAGTGTIEEWWAGPAEYRIIFSLPGYHATVLRQGGDTFRTPGTTPPPFLPRYLLQEVLQPMPPAPDISHFRSELAKRSFGDLTLDCISLLSSASAPVAGNAFCLEPGKTDLRITTAPSLLAVRSNSASSVISTCRSTWPSDQPLGSPSAATSSC